jgi:hypothetical protein
MLRKHERRAWLVVAVASLTACGTHVVNQASGSASSSGSTTGSGGATVASGIGASASGNNGGGSTGTGNGGQASCVTDAIASAPDGVGALALDDTTAYWTDSGFNGEVWSAPNTGGKATLLAKSPPTVNSTVGIAVDAASVYWGNADGSVYRVPKGGGAVTTILPAVADGSPSGFTIDDANVFAIAPQGSSAVVVKIPKAGGSQLVLATPTQPGDILVADSTYVYWLDIGDLTRAPKAGGATEQYPFNSGALVALAADDSGVYGLDNECSVVRFTSPSAPGLTLFKGGFNDVCGGGIAVDATNVYWSGSTYDIPYPTTLYAIPKGGGSRTARLTCPAYDAAMSSVVAIDTQSIFWSANNPETVLRLPK